MRTTLIILVLLLLSGKSSGQDNSIDDNFGFKEYLLLRTLDDLDKGNLELNKYSTKKYLKEYRVNDSTLTVGGEKVAFLTLYFLSDSLVRIEVGIDFPRTISDAKTFYNIILEKYGDPSEISKNEVMNDHISLDVNWASKKYRLKYSVSGYAGRDRRSTRDFLHSLVYETSDLKERLYKVRDKKIKESSKDF